MKNFIRFLGTSGGRFVMASQLRSSAGLFIHINEKNIIFDPGPGALIKYIDSHINLREIDAIILSHSHIDHSNDVNVMIDVITNLTKKDLILFAPEECINGENRILLNYLKEKIKIEILKPQTNYTIEDLKFTSIEHKHGIECYGIKFNEPKISFITDSKFFPELIEYYRSSEILIMNIVMYKCKNDVLHLCVDDGIKILNTIKPKRCVITHFGMSMLKGNPEKIAKMMSEKTGVEVIAAKDGMILNIDEEEKQTTLF